LTGIASAPTAFSGASRIYSKNSGGNDSNNTIVLLHNNAVSVPTVYTNEAYNNTITVSTSASAPDQISTQSKFGSGAAYFASANSEYLSLNNATSYSVDVYLSYAGTPIVTPTPSYNYTPTLTPITTDTPMPTSTVISTPLLYVHVWDADGGMSYPISSAIVTIYDGDEVDQTYKGAIMYTAYTDTAGNIEPLQIESNSAFWASISKSGYYTQIQRYRMTTGTESHIYVPLKRVGGNVTVVTTQPTLVLPTPGGTGIQGGFIGWILDYFSEWFGVDTGTARILLALFIIMCSSVFVGGSLAGFGSGAGAGMGALIGGMFAFIAMCYVQFLPFWLLPIGIAFVGMAFFVWNGQEK